METSPDVDEHTDVPGTLDTFEDTSYVENTRPALVEAETVYLLMPKNVPVTRASRLQWLLDHINSVISVSTNSDADSYDDLEVISIVPADVANNSTSFMVTTGTNVVFLARSYRFVYCLDMSPSQSAVDLEKGEILFDQILHRFKISLQGVCREFTIPGNTIVFQPCLYLTVIVNTPFFISPAQQVLVKGVQVSSHNIEEIISLVQQHFHLLEGRIAHVAAMAYDQMELQLMENEGMVGALFDLSDNECIANIPMVSPDANFVNMLRYSILAISLLPENSLSHILVITDGVVAMPDSNIMESILFQLHFDSISVSFIKVGSPFHPHTSAGYVSYTDLLYFLSHTTLGTYLENFPPLNPEPTLDVNIFHKLYLFWTYHCKSKYVGSLMTAQEQSYVIRNSSFYSNRVPTLLSKRQAEENINASLPLLLCRRIREGYTVTGVEYHNDILKVKLCLHWKAFIFVHYILTLQWPAVKNTAHFEVHISAPYDFLHDITCLMKKETKSSYRQAVFERFWIRLTQLTSSDTVLAQSLSSFQNNNLWYSLPESVKSGIPAFILNNATSHDGTKLVLSPRDNTCSKFLSLWQPICQLETSNWRKWFHTHKLSLILKHDHPLPKHIHMANSSGRFQVIQCRQAATALYSLLSDWSSFILIDNHTYVKLLHKEHDKPPVWFCIVRVTSKFPCATLNLGFVTGTPGIIRYKICEDLKSEVSSLSYLPTKKSKEGCCCTLLQKPLEKILIRYERMPNDFHTVIFPDGTQPPHAMQSLPSSPLAGTLFTTLSRYLFHQRWIWSATHTSDTRLGVTAMSRILSTITKMRLEEGFNFAHSSAGIVTMAIELSMDSNASCTVQYVLFPPHSSWWGEGDAHSGSDDDGEIEPEIDCELQMVTEVWIEPQNGHVSTNSTRLKYMNNKAYYEIAEVVRTLDLKCITSLLTLEHLSLKCQDKKTRPLEAAIPTYRSNKHVTNLASKTCKFNFDHSSTNLDSKAIWNPLFVHRIQHIPFQFDLIDILPLCQQTELLFSMFIENIERSYIKKCCDNEKSNKLLMENIHHHLQYLHDYKLELTIEESSKFTNQVIMRHRNKFPNLCPISVSTENVSCELVGTIFPQWSCYVKGISVTHVILTFIPTTLRDLKMLSTYDTNSNSSFMASSEGTDRAPSQSSNYSEVPINITNSLLLPLYAYDCPLASLVDSYIHNPGEEHNYTRDIYEDHRFKVESFVQEDSVRLNDQNDEDVSPEPRSEESDGGDHRSSVKQHCKALFLAFSKCFTMSLFSALHFGSFVHHSDVQSAMDQCEETTYEIDITTYLQTICSHLKQSHEDEVSLQYLNQPAPCIELKPLHRLIKEKFFDITSVSFNPIPTYKEYYYCRNLSYEKANIKNDSDDEISNPPSEIVEFKSDKEISVSSEGPCYLQTHLKNQEQNCTNNNLSPLFLHFICTMRHNNDIANASVKLLPTCLGELIQYVESPTSHLQKSNLQVTLDILCLTLPTDVQNVITDYSNKGLRTTSFCSDGFQPSIGSSISDGSFSSDFKDQEPLLYIPELQRSAISTLREEIKWLLKDEIATSLLDIEPVTLTSLNFVIKHVSDSMSRSSCLMDIIDLNFVYGSSHSYEKFVQEFSKITIPQYKLVKEGELYYVAKSKEVNKNERKETTSIMSSSGYDNFILEDINFILTEDKRHDSVDMDCLEVKSDDVFSKNDDFTSQSDISSIQGSILGTDGGYDEDVSECDEDFDWLIDLNNKRPNLPNFWLVMQIDQDAVTIYFHCRFLELHTTHVGVYLSVQRAICDAIRDICKRVNQSLLLQSLHDTRSCDHLLEADDSLNEWSNETNSPTRSTSFSRLKSMDEISDEAEPYPPALIEASLKFKAGYFSCPIVWETHFVLHPRLKTGPGISGISISIIALKSVLHKFSVSNRKNMFVYQDSDSYVFYLRLHENLQSIYKGQFKSNEFENSLVSRSPSIASLPIGPRNNLAKSDHSISSSNSELRPRVRSFGEKETKEGPYEDTIILRVHGITEAGKDVRCDLVQVLQNRLDDAVLELLSIMLARNAMCPLTPEDVRFLQKPFRPPEVIIRLSVQEYALNLLVPFAYYLKQNLLQFLNIPKYTDSRPHYHFKDYAESEQTNYRYLEDNIFIYNQSQNTSSGNRGIACIALTISDQRTDNSDNNAVNMATLFNGICFDDIVSSQILENEGNLPNTYLEFRLWKQGRVNVDNLCQKLRAATSQAMWDLIMEYYLLKQPLCTKDHLLKNKLRTSATNRSILKTLKVVKPSNKEVFYKVLLDMTLDKRKNCDEKKINKEVIINFETQTSKKRPRKVPSNSLVQRSITFDEYTKDSKENVKPSWKTNIALDAYELGSDGVLSDNYSNTLREWFEFGDKINAPAIRKTKITLANQHLLNITIKELQNLIIQISHDTVRTFSSEITEELGDDVCEELYVPYGSSSYATKCIIISRNFEQWKGSTAFRGSLDFPDLLSQQALKNVQKFTPTILNGKMFIPRQKILWGTINSDTILLYTYNWSKDNVDKLVEYGNNVGLWLSVRASLLHSITAQKCGLFCNQAISRKSMFSTNNPYMNYIGDIDHMMKFPKDRSRRFAAHSVHSPLPTSTVEAFKDMYVHKPIENADPVVAFTIEMYNLKRVDKKHRDELKKLHSMYQSRTNTSTHTQIQILMQNSRTIHYCHTPLLFLSRWRIQAAATRDHSINPPSLETPPQHQNADSELWHETLCFYFINEYKRYLQTLGFMALEVDKKLGIQKTETPYNSIYYMQKAILGGILIFTVQLTEPFFITKLHAIECNRLQSTNSRTSINQFTLSFIDECDKIKIFIHLHSFTYDFHLRCVYNFVSNGQGAKFCEGYHIIHFLDDFMKYYNKAPNYARNLVHTDTITINDLLTEGKYLYSYLLDNIKQYHFSKLKMNHDNDPSEYVLVQVSNTPQISYKDSQDRQHTDDFDVTLIICNAYESWDNSLHLKYYLILTSRGEKYPKSEVERKLGKFRTVSSIGRNLNSEKSRLISESDSRNTLPEEKEESEKSMDTSLTESLGDTESNKSSSKTKDNSEPDGDRSTITSTYEIKQESVNYLGYYSSHEQIMQQLILDCASATQKQITDMVSRGTVHCRTHLLWEKLLTQKDSTQMTYIEFIELKNLSKLQNLCDLNTNLHPLLNHQPVTWYQGLSKLLLVKYNEQYRSFISADGNIQHIVILHPTYAGAFMMLSMDLHTSRGDLYAVHRTSHYEAPNSSNVEREVLINGFIHCVCFYLWSGMI